MRPPDLSVADSVEINNQTMCTKPAVQSEDSLHPNHKDTLAKLGLESLDIDACEVSHYWKGQLLQLIQKYEDVLVKCSHNQRCSSTATPSRLSRSSGGKHYIQRNGSHIRLL